jgi:hypothetical protein
VEALIALENDGELVASTTGFDWVINCRQESFRVIILLDQKGQGGFGVNEKQ